MPLWSCDCLSKVNETLDCFEFRQTADIQCWRGGWKNNKAVYLSKSHIVFTLLLIVCKGRDSSLLFDERIVSSLLPFTSSSFRSVVDAYPVQHLHAYYQVNRLSFRTCAGNDSFKDVRCKAVHNGASLGCNKQSNCLYLHPWDVSKKRAWCLLKSPPLLPTCSSTNTYFWLKYRTSLFYLDFFVKKKTSNCNHQFWIFFFCLVLLIN